MVRAADNIDMLSLSGHKFHAPKGVGALYCKKSVPIRNFIEGGAQERSTWLGSREPLVQALPELAQMPARSRRSNRLSPSIRYGNGIQ